MKKNIIKNQSGVTLVESLVAMMIMVVGLVAMLSLALSSLERARVSKEQIVATTLVREGIEIVRTIRDTNWLQGVDCWDDAIPTACGLVDGLYAIDYEDIALPTTLSSSDDIEDFDFTSSSGVDTALWKDVTSGFYNHGSGDDTLYKRVVEIKDISSSESKRIRCRVYWENRGRTFHVDSETVLTNWR